MMSGRPLPREVTQAIVLSAGHAENGNISSMSRERGQHSVLYAHQHPELETVIYSGGEEFLHTGPINEPVADGMLWVALINNPYPLPDRIHPLVEHRSTDIVTNFVFSRPLIDPDKRLAVVTHLEDWKLAQWAGALVIPGIELVPAVAHGLPKARDYLKHVANRLQYQAAFRDVEPGNIEAIRAADKAFQKKVLVNQARFHEYVERPARLIITTLKPPRSKDAGDEK